ncbi:hypothetical protein DMENIID0001_082350 [Sergentomyia squamirostris]
MLAEPKKHTSYIIQPRGKPLYEDADLANSFGMKMLTKMGWNKDKGLGAKENGSKDFIRVRYKNGSTGMGFQEKDTQWTEHEDNFSELLNNLQSGQDEESSRNCESLEEKSRNSRARVHYKKFTRGKDISQYSEKDLANIFGRKSLRKELGKYEEKDEGPCGPSSNFGVETTTSKLSMKYYFKKKMSQLDASTPSTVQSFETSAEPSPDSSGSEKKAKKKKKNRQETDLHENPIENSEMLNESLKKKRKVKKEQDPEIKTDVPEEEPKKRKRKAEKLEENQEVEKNLKEKVDEDVSSVENSRKLKKKQKKLVAVEQTLQLESEAKKTKSKKKNKQQAEEIEKTVQDSEENSQPALDNSSADRISKISRKKRKQKAESSEISEIIADPPTKKSKKSEERKEQDLQGATNIDESEDSLSKLKECLAEYSASGDVFYKLPMRKCDILMKLDCGAFKGSNISSIIGYRLTEKIDLDVIETSEEGASDEKAEKEVDP